MLLCVGSRHAAALGGPAADAPCSPSHRGHRRSSRRVLPPEKTRWLLRPGAGRMLFPLALARILPKRTPRRRQPPKRRAGSLSPARCQPPLRCVFFRQGLRTYRRLERGLSFKTNSSPVSHSSTAKSDRHGAQWPSRLASMACRPESRLNPRRAAPCTRTDTVTAIGQWRREFSRFSMVSFLQVFRPLGRYYPCCQGVVRPNKCFT